MLAVRAIYLRAFVALARWRYADALALFRSAARSYSQCQDRDVDLATGITHQIASLEQSLRSASEAGSHRNRRLPGSAFGPAIVTPDRLGIGYDDAWLYALDGDDIAAFRMARETDELARALNETPWRVWTLANRAAIAAAFGEHAGAHSFAEAADKLAATVDWNETRDTQRFSLLQIAEVRAIVAPATALDALRRYDAVSNRWIERWYSGIVTEMRGCSAGIRSFEAWCCVHKVISMSRRRGSPRPPRRFACVGIFGARLWRSSSSVRRRVKQLSSIVRSQS